jgi:hypothetical protein
MKYMVLMYSNPAETKAMSASDLDVVLRKHEALRAELTDSGELLNGAGLAFPEDTTNLRLRDGLPVALDGPLRAAEEHMTAYYVFDCADRDRALAIAERLLDSHVTAVEVRDIHDSAGMPGVSSA